MIGINVSKQRFSLYDLDEGEMFIKDYVSIVTYYVPNINKVETISGILYLGSRSLIFEPDNSNYSLVKFHFKEITNLPYLIPSKVEKNKSSLNFEINRIIEIPKGDFTEPYKIIDLLNEKNNNKISITFNFEKIEEFTKLINELIDKYHNKASYFEFDNLEYLGNIYTFKFDLTLIKSINEKYLINNELFAKQQLPLIEVPGVFMLTDQRVYFQPFYKLNNERVFKIKLKKIKELYKRKVNLFNVGIEIISDKKNLLLEYENEKTRDFIYSIIEANVDKNNCETNINIFNYTNLWCDGKISNYEYLIKLNSASNRTRNDLSQYPIFPWILNNYTSNIIDLNDPSNYRDLSKPIGALNEKRLSEFIKRFKEMPGEAEKKFIYGTFYSTSAYVIGFLSRKYPEYMLKLHGGKFDHPDRLFHSIKIDWDINLNNPGSLKELIPEFFEENDDFLKNNKNIDFGNNSTGEKIDNVILPNWCDNNPKKFLEIMKESLESKYVDEHLHEWIDLIFGYKQRGENAIKAFNLFYPTTYEDGKDLEYKTFEERTIIQTQAKEFGICPNQLFSNPHPKKFSKGIGNTFESNNKIINNAINNNINEGNYSKINLNDNEKNLNDNNESIKYNLLKYEYKNLSKHLKQKITCINYLNTSKILATGGEDGYIKLYDLSTLKTKRMAQICNLSLNCMSPINENNLIAIGASDNKVYILNTTLCKAQNKFEAHEDSVINLFYSHSINKLITDGADSTYKIWDLNDTKYPIHTFYEVESPIISCDYRDIDQLHLCLDSEKNFVLRKIDKSINEYFKLNLNDKSTNFVKFNKNNLNEYFISSKNKFDIYDIRMNKIIYSLEKYGKVLFCENDSENIIIANKDKAFITKLYDNEILKEYQFGDISYMYYKKIKIENNEKNLLCIGNEIGDLYYSLNNY